MAALAWTRHWTGAVVAEYGLEDAPSDAHSPAGAWRVEHAQPPESGAMPTRALHRAATHGSVRGLVSASDAAAIEEHSAPSELGEARRRTLFPPWTPLSVI